METTYLDCSWGSACVCKLVGCIIIWKEEGPYQSLLRYLESKLLLPGWGWKAAKYGGFWQFHLAILEFDTKGSGQTKTLAKTRAVNTEGWMGCDFCRTSYNMVIKWLIRREQLGPHSIVLKIVSWEDSSALKICLFVIIQNLKDLWSRSFPTSGGL